MVSISLNDLFKDINVAVQKTKDSDLLGAILEVQRLAFELQRENDGLKEHIKKMQDNKELEELIERTKDGYYITFSNDTEKIRYCTPCWDSDRKLIQLKGDIGFCEICSRNHRR